MPSKVFYYMQILAILWCLIICAAIIQGFTYMLCNEKAQWNQTHLVKEKDHLLLKVRSSEISMQCYVLEGKRDLMPLKDMETFI